MSRLYLAGAAILATVALAAATPSVAEQKPSPGIDIIVQIKGSTAVVALLAFASVVHGGTFAGQLELPAGTYTVRTACSLRVRCPAHRLTSLVVNGRSVSIAANGGIFVAAGDINGDGRADLTTISGTISLGR